MEIEKHTKEKKKFKEWKENYQIPGTHSAEAINNVNENKTSTDIIRNNQRVLFHRQLLSQLIDGL